MVKDEAQRVRWTSYRRAGQSDAEDGTESILLGRTPLVPANDYEPLPLEDPWWIKLTGYRSQKKAFLFAGIVISIGLYLIIAGTVQLRFTRAVQLSERLHEHDTSGNSISSWLSWIQSHRFQRPLYSGVQHIDQRLALKCAAEGWSHACTKKVFSEARMRQRAGLSGAGLGPQISETVTYDRRRGRGRSPPGDGELRLPVGVALAYHTALFNLQAKECASGDIFHYLCWTATRRNKHKLESLRRSLFRIILHIAPTADGGGRLQGKRLQLLNSLVKEARRQGITTDIPQSSLDATSSQVLRENLIKVQQDVGSKYRYSDLMLYPDSPALLYRGFFLGLKFDGMGDLYYAAGDKVAYRGEWKAGRMHGRGTLFSEDGDQVWDGDFVDGRPVRPLWVV